MKEPSPAPSCSIRRGRSTISGARWRARTRVCGSTASTTRASSTSRPSSPRSTTASAPAAERTDRSAVTPGFCPWSSSASQWRGVDGVSLTALYLSISFLHDVIVLVCLNASYFLCSCSSQVFCGVSAGRTGTSPRRKCLPARRSSSACCPERRPAGGRSRWPSVWKVRSTLCGQINTKPPKKLRYFLGLADRDKTPERNIKLRSRQVLDDVRSTFTDGAERARWVWWIYALTDQFEWRGFICAEVKSVVRFRNVKPTYWTFRIDVANIGWPNILTSPWSHQTCRALTICYRNPDIWVFLRTSATSQLKLANIKCLSAAERLHGSAALGSNKHLCLLVYPFCFKQWLHPLK